MRVIIIGSRGFIGHHLFHFLTEKGNEVWGADVVDDYINKDRFFLIDASNSDFNTVFQAAEYEICINCSGAASVPESMVNPLRDFYLNTVNVFKILESIRRNQPSCKFMNLSSAAVYGNPANLPVKEDARPNPLSPYGYHKLQAEQICKEYFDFYALKTCSLRIFSVYGPGLKKQLFWDLLKKIKKGVPFSLYGTGNESRDFIFIYDLVRAIEIIARHSTFDAEIINVANGEEIYIRDVVSVFSGFFDPGVRYSFTGETREGDPLNWLADIRKLLSFGYRPSFSMNSGLKQYHDWATHTRFD